MKGGARGAASLAMALALAASSSGGCGDDAPAEADGGADGGADVDGGEVAVTAGSDQELLGGMAFELGFFAEFDVTDVSWSQTAGEPILDGDVARVPAGAASGTSYSFRVRVTAVGGAVAEDDVTLTVVDADFEDFLAEIDSPAELGTSEGIAFAPDRDSLWVVSMDGFVSQFDRDGAFLRRVDLGGQPVGANFVPGVGLVIADAAGERLIALDTDAADPAPATFVDALSDGGDLGPLNYPVYDYLGRLYVSNRVGQQVIRHDLDRGETEVIAEGFGENPNGMTLGPSPDTLYVGVRDAVWKIPDAATCAPCTPEVYIDQLDCDEVDGLAFDEHRNLFVGCPNVQKLHIVTWGDDEGTLTRTFDDPGGNIGRFTSLTWAPLDAAGPTLYWTNLGDRTVGRLDVGGELP